MADDGVSVLLVRASRSLGECEYWLRHFGFEDGGLGPLADARRCCDEAERKNVLGDTETAATIAVLRSTAAAFALRHCVCSKVNCDFDDADGTLLDGLGEHDKEGLSRPLTEQAIRAARAALNADPEDALVPLHLGHALTWSGDRDGAIAAYEEALHRDPGESCARSCLEYFDALPAGHSSPNEMSWDEARMWGEEPHISEISHGRHGFALLRVFFEVNNNDSDHRFLLFSSVADARTYADERLSIQGIDPAEDDEGEDDGAVLHIHRPGRPVAGYDLRSRVRAAPEGGSSRVDWSDIPVHEPLESPLPPGRPLRINTRTCF
ncbi:tetratricopeptide repeat protein [Spirillospora sp. NBC_01491]|uniref:tetratricopeptide repeat protein n=1 Tax=Spirillospora sp. NBC_01491 TaxID=2976007 RepID=UPI002E3784BA|nr:hypothetical protein [Spirillospora sp. NBC_01491]